MLSKLTTSPLLWATGVLALLLAASAAINVQQWKKIGAARAECLATKLQESNERSTVVRDLEADALRNQVTTLEAELGRYREVAKAAESRHIATSQLLSGYRKELNEARKADPRLDEPADTSRLRALEAAYRVRTQGSGGDSVSSNP